MPQPWETSPAQDHAAVTPSDVTVYNPPFRALYVGGAGTVVVTSAKGNVATYTVPAGGRVDIVGTKVAAASTATGIVAMY